MCRAARAPASAELAEPRHALPRGDPAAAAGAAGPARRAARGRGGGAGGRAARRPRRARDREHLRADLRGVRLSPAAARRARGRHGCACRRSPSARTTCRSSRASSWAGTPGGAGAVVERLSDESERRLCAYRWPGNLRELESVLERAVLLGARAGARGRQGAARRGAAARALPPADEARRGRHGRGLARAAPAARAAVRGQADPRRPARRRPPRGRARALPARGPHDRAPQLAEHGAAVRLRRQRVGQPLLRDGAAATASTCSRW